MTEDEDAGSYIGVTSSSAADNPYSGRGDKGNGSGLGDGGVGASFGLFGADVGPYTSGSQASGMAVPGVSSLVIDCSGARKGGVK